MTKRYRKKNDKNGRDVLLSELQFYVWALGYELTLRFAKQPRI